MISKSARRHQERLLGLILLIVTISVFWQVQSHDFIPFDDPVYVVNNPHVQSGLTGRTILWALTSTEAGFWHPLTWLSLMVDYELYGLFAGGYHCTNLLFHIGATLLLFLTLQRMTGAVWRSCFVAALFAIHPLHVESVAWVAQRKDVLSGFFWMLTVYFYVLYVERPGWLRYILVISAFVLGLMGKPMLVTLPFVLLLLDYWPLGRFHLLSVGRKETAAHVFRMISEKVPLLIIVAFVSVLTLITEIKIGALKSIEDFPFDVRIANALVSYCVYLRKTIWPSDLAVFYPHPGTYHLYKVAGSFLILALVTFFVMRWIRRLPYLALGWFWYLGTLFPVVGLIQIGAHAMADRYTYIPLIGIFLIVAWGVPDLLKGWHYKEITISLTAVIVISVLMVVSWRQVTHWQNTATLFGHAVSVTRDNYLAHFMFARAEGESGNPEAALAHYNKALQINPAFVAWMHNQKGYYLTKQGRLDEAISEFKEALKIRPDYANAHNNLGVVLARKGRLDEAISELEEALKISPRYSEARANLKNVRREKQR